MDELSLENAKPPALLVVFNCNAAVATAVVVETGMEGLTVRAWSSMVVLHRLALANDPRPCTTRGKKSGVAEGGPTAHSHSLAYVGSEVFYNR